LLKVDNLSKTFHIHILGNKVINALRGISFHVKRGEFLGISGASGSGKSTILKCIYRTYLSTEGRIWFDASVHGELDIASAPNQTVLDIRRKDIGYISQFLKIIPRVPAIDIVAEPLVTKKRMPPHEAKKIAGELLRKLNIPDYLFDAYPSSFSGGEQQRVNIARAVIWAPRLLLLDEPTSSLDKSSTDIVIELLMMLKEHGTTMIGIFHDRNIMDLITDKTYEIQQEVTTDAA
jgi:alpha-D-ribose 1-methylphosphonate 5-triphosphate synthase subunit PhnL